MPLLPLGGAIADHAVGDMTIAHRRCELDQEAVAKIPAATIDLTSHANAE